MERYTKEAPMVPGLELVAGYLFAWAVRKAKRAGAQVDGEADRVLDAGLARLHEMVTARIGADPALAQLERDAAADIDNERTRRRVRDAVEQAVEDDPSFAEQLRQILAELATAGGGPSGGIQHAGHTGSVSQSKVSGIAVTNTGVVGSDINVSGSGH